MRALFLTNGAEDPSTRYRVHPVIECWRAKGGEAIEAAVPPAGRERRRLWDEARRVDVVHWQRRLVAPLDAARLVSRCRRLVFDFDDALSFRDDGSVSRLRHLKLRALVRGADDVIAGNAQLASLARRAGARSVKVVPTAVRIPSTDAPPLASSGPTRLGWIGSRATLPYLSAIAEPLKALARRRSNWELRVVCDAFPDLPGVTIECVPWSPGGEDEAVAGFDIGLAPLPDDPWTQGKCGLKILQCFAAGRPVVASPVGVQRSLIGPGARGRLAVTPRDWIETLEELLDAPEERTRLGAAARLFVRRSFERSRWAAEVVRAMAGFAETCA